MRERAERCSQDPNCILVGNRGNDKPSNSADNSSNKGAYQVSANTPPPSTGKASIEPEVKGQRREVDLRINLTYKDEKGNPVDSKLTQGLTKNAEKSWSGNVGGFKLDADFDDPNATTVNVNLHPGAGISNANRVGGNTLNLFLGGYQSGSAPVIPYTSDVLNTVFGHEVGHVLGARDRYGSDGKAFPGHENDIMGSVRKGNRPLPSTVREILLYNGVKP